MAAALLLLGVPSAFAAAGGVPHQTPSAPKVQAWLQGPLEPGNAAITAWIAVWLIWGAVAGLVVAAIGRRAARVRWHRLVGRLPAPMQGLAATIVGATALTAPLAATAAHAAPVPATVGDTHDLSAGTRTGHQPPPSATSAAQAAGSSLVQVVVRDGDTLSSIAERCLGDENQWPAIFALNEGRYFDDIGGTFTDPDLIYPGWTLQLPTEAAAPDSPRHRPPTRDGNNTPSPGPSANDPQPAQPAPTAVPAGPSAAATPAHPGASSDGNTLPEPTAAPAEGNASGPQSSGAEPPAGDAARRAAPPGVQLATGSWLDLGLATAVAAAAALVWAHRRRRYRRHPLTPELRLDDPDLTALPRAVTDIRRRLRITVEPATASTPTATDLVPAHTTETDEPDGGDPGTGHAAAGGTGSPRPQSGIAPARPVTPTLTNPAAVAWPASGLGLTGPGAEPAARGFLAAALADRDPQAPPAQVVLPATTAATLFGSAADTLPATPRMTITADLADALNLLEHHVLQRTRLIDDHQVDSIADLRITDPHEEPAPPILLLADATDSRDHMRMTALLAQGHRLDIHGILLGAWTTGDTLVVNTDGSTTPVAASHHSGPLADLGRIAVLTQADALAVITTVIESHTGLPLAPAGKQQRPSTAVVPAAATSDDGQTHVRPDRVLHALANLGETTAAAVAAHLTVSYPTATAELIQHEHDGHTETVRTDTGRTLWRLTDTGRATLTPTDTTPAAPPATSEPATTEPDTAPTAVHNAAAAGRYADVDAALRWPDPDTSFTSDHPPAPPGTDDSPPGHVEVTVLGTAGIVAVNPDRTPRKKALELLVYLAVNDGSATVDAILEDLLPDAPTSKAPERLYTYVSDLRAVMRRIGGPGTYLTHPQRRYTLNPDTITIDLWQMRAAIREAQQATDTPQRINALHRVVKLYRGPLAEDTDYEWAEPYREAIRQQALDAHLALADALTGNPNARAQVLAAAIAHSPYSEQLYQDAMHAYAELGHLDAIRALRRDLTRALAEIDAEPDDQTIGLADQLIADLHQKPRRNAAQPPTEP
ncbi:BTAD domain-containing putative transcriptional regulator [Actinoplanes sp. M2I2]|uniref:BTAD domain-containing putative transcriptional regulator n=1 Tax=Actinoplanes sp. M2I2 TaxID=1734444 RepID=UPI002020933A|nr:BTAD domain-containing putative transcriptional regulator [Actinoplanes sp. M2I2]